MSDEIKITDQSGDKDYFTMVPNYVLNHSTMWDREVYIQMKRISGENGTCWASKSKLAEQCGMSVNRLKKSINYLVESKWIELVGEKSLQTSGGKQLTKEYKIINIWDLNYQWKIKKGGNGVSRYNTLSGKGGSSGDTPLNKGGSYDDTKGGSPGDDNKEPLNKEPSCEKEFSQDCEEEEITIESVDEDGNPTEKKDTRRVKDKEKIYFLFGKKKQPWWYHKQERIAALRLFDMKGYDKVKRAVEFMKKNKKDVFCPQATKPFELEQKWDNLLNYKNKL